MSRIVFPADSAGEAKAYIRALTGVQNVTVPAAPSPDLLGTVLDVKSKFVSVSASMDIGFGYGAVGSSADVKVLVQDYWYYKEVEGGITEVNSWTFAAGFRVGILIVGFKTDLNVSLGVLAAKAEMEHLNAQLQILRVGMPSGPSVPVSLATPTSLNVDKFGELKNWEGSVIKYVDDHRKDLTPVLVSASVNINGERLLTEAPGVRYALWRIVGGQTLKEAIGLLTAGKAPEVEEGQVRAIYSAVFNDPTMAIQGHSSENRRPDGTEKKEADRWLTGYKKL